MSKFNSRLFSIPVFVILLLIITFPFKAEATSDRPFSNAANWGGTGLMEIPNARILEDGVVRIGGAVASPYRWVTGGMGVLPGVEFSGRLTAITNISALTDDYGSNKDKALDFKYQIIPESRYLPAIAFGMHDFWGTGLFTAEYLVMSRQLYPFDFTLGIGSKRLKGAELPFAKDYGIFGGMEWAINNRFQFMVEYNPVEYREDKPGARGVPQGAESPVNIGLRAKLLSWVDMGVSFQRGDTLGLMFHIHNELGEPVLPFRPDPPHLVSVDRRPFDKRDQRKMIEAIHKEITDAGFPEASVFTDGKDLVAEFENTKYLDNQKAAGRVLRVLLFHSPEDTNRLTAVLKSRNIPILRISVKPDHLEKYIFGEIPEEIFFDGLLDVELASGPFESGPEDYRVVKSEKKRFDYSVDPLLNIYWNDPSGFFKFRTGISGNVSMDLWKGAILAGRAVLPVYSNIESPTSDKFPEDVVRSDIHRYMKSDDYTIDRLMFNQTFRLSERLFGRFSLGYFERMYAGAGGEALYFAGDGRFAFGVEADLVKKRVAGEIFELMDRKRHSVLGNFYYYYPDLEISFHTQYGRFLAGDVGWMFDFSRRYRTGVVLGMYMSFTDTDGVEPAFINEDYNHKGIYLSLPLRAFLTHDSTRSLGYGISPWTRDVGQSVTHWRSLFDLAGDLMPAKFRARQEELKK